MFFSSGVWTRGTNFLQRIRELELRESSCVDSDCADDVIDVLSDRGRGGWGRQEVVGGGGWRWEGWEWR